MSAGESSKEPVDNVEQALRNVLVFRNLVRQRIDNYPSQPIEGRMKTSVWEFPSTTMIGLMPIKSVVYVFDEVDNFCKLEFMDEIGVTIYQIDSFDSNEGADGDQKFDLSIDEGNGSRLPVQTEALLVTTLQSLITDLETSGSLVSLGADAVYPQRNYNF